MSPATNPIRYRSTHCELPGGSLDHASFPEALFRGIAPDGGLYMPDGLPRLDPDRLAALRSAPYAQVACEILFPFVEGLLTKEAFLRLCEEAYPFAVPIEPLEDTIRILRLDRGPTASFKDFAARWMARMMQALRAPGEERTVLVATSGDTGSAVGEAFRGLDGFRVVLLYPEHEVSPVQKQQLEGVGLNVRALSVDGTFDECQALVKRAFSDPALSRLRLTSANSINIGRILPQSVYYVYAWLRVAPDGGPITFGVPSGNLGNSFGCELARRMGLPVKRLLLAVNENDEVPRFLEAGDYAPVRPSRACLSNAMNVGNPSNLARFFDVFGGILRPNGDVVRAPDLATMRSVLTSVSVSDEETAVCMRETWMKQRVLLDPHGAVGVAALHRLGASSEPCVCLETAHPAKFPEIVEKVLGFKPEPPDAFRAMEGRTPACERISSKYESLCETLLRHV